MVDFFSLFTRHSKKQLKNAPKTIKEQKKGTSDHEIIILTPAKKSDFTQTEKSHYQVDKNKNVCKSALKIKTWKCYKIIRWREINYAEEEVSRSILKS